MDSFFNDYSYGLSVKEKLFLHFCNVIARITALIFRKLSKGCQLMNENVLERMNMNNLAFDFPTSKITLHLSIISEFLLSFRKSL